MMRTVAGGEAEAGVGALVGIVIMTTMDMATTTVTETTTAMVLETAMATVMEEAGEMAPEEEALALEMEEGGTTTDGSSCTSTTRITWARRAT